MKKSLAFTVSCLLFTVVVSADYPGDWSGSPQEAFLNSPIVQKYQCTSCHTITVNGGTVGPNLNRVGQRRSSEWLANWLLDPQTIKPGTRMPTFEFEGGELELAVKYLSKMKRETHFDEIMTQDLPIIEKGELLFKDYDCSACHRLGSEGRFVGPDLTLLGIRKTLDWEKIWLRDPSGFKPGTFMPNFHIPEEGVEALATFVTSQKGDMVPESQNWEFMTNMFLGNDAKERGELLFRRFACWSCHGEGGTGGVINPNMAPDEVIPGLKKVVDEYTRETLGDRLQNKVTPKALDETKPDPPFFCPDYANYMDQNELDDLYAYLKSIAPKKSRFFFK